MDVVFMSQPTGSLVVAGASQIPLWIVINAARPEPMLYPQP
jgi:hypothetical protein